mmetsp:Transcript_36368/g.91473  ORF Transcript_36368/g.91473 Transcript_36368/m.91473 type:complete len:1284 (+) Transcript_36368:260-4111(+)
MQGAGGQQGPVPAGPYSAPTRQPETTKPEIPVSELAQAPVCENSFELPNSLSVLNELSIPVWVVDFEVPRILWGNRSTCYYFGKELDQLVGMDLLKGRSAARAALEDEMFQTVQVKRGTQHTRKSFHPDSMPSVTFDLELRPVNLQLPGEKEPRTVALNWGYPVLDSSVHNESTRAMEMLRYSDILMMLFQETGELLNSNVQARSFYFGATAGTDGQEGPPRVKGREITLRDVLDTCVWDGLETTQQSVWEQVCQLKAGDNPIVIECRKADQRTEARCTSGGTTEIIHSIKFIPTYDPVSGTRCLLVNETDVSELSSARAEQRALLAETKVKEKFLTAVSHELRTPLNGIIGLSEALLTNALCPENMESSLHAIKKSGCRLAALVDDILDVASLQAQKPRIVYGDVSIADVAKNVIDTTRPLLREGVELINLISETPMVQGDSARIAQILTNLVGNCVKFTHHGSITLSAAFSENNFVIKVCDTGIGIPSDKRDLVFLPFTQVDAETSRKYGGTGLGLSLVRQLVEAHNGNILIESLTELEREERSREAGVERDQLKVGTTIIVTMPTSRPEQQGEAFRRSDSEASVVSGDSSGSGNSKNRNLRFSGGSVDWRPPPSSNGVATATSPTFGHVVSGFNPRSSSPGEVPVPPALSSGEQGRQSMLARQDVGVAVADAVRKKDQEIAELQGMIQKLREELEAANKVEDSMAKSNPVASNIDCEVRDAPVAGQHSNARQQAGFSVIRRRSLTSEAKEMHEHVTPHLHDDIGAARRSPSPLPSARRSPPDASLQSELVQEHIAIAQRAKLSSPFEANGLVATASSRASDVEMSKKWRSMSNPGMDSEASKQQESIFDQSNDDFRFPNDKVSILTVDDEEVNNLVITGILGTEGYKVFLASSGEEALALVREGKVMPNVVLLDVMMPSMNGFEACKILRQEFPTLVIILCSAKGSREDTVNGFLAGANDYVTKPVNSHELRARISAHLHSQQLWMCRLSAMTSDSLLKRMLPANVIERLKNRKDSRAIVDYHKSVSVLFSDIVSFTSMCEHARMQDVVDMLNDLYHAFDGLCDLHGIEKTEVIGDGYMCVCGHQSDKIDHAHKMVAMAIGMVAATKKISNPLNRKEHIRIRVGINSGPLVSGVVGDKVPKWSLFGDTVNTASRMESHGMPMNVFVSKATRNLLQYSDYEFLAVPSRIIKGKGEMETFAVKHKDLCWQDVEAMITGVNESHSLIHEAHMSASDLDLQGSAHRTVHGVDCSTSTQALLLNVILCLFLRQTWGFPSQGPSLL